MSLKKGIRCALNIAIISNNMAYWECFCFRRCIFFAQFESIEMEFNFAFTRARTRTFDLTEKVIERGFYSELSEFDNCKTNDGIHKHFHIFFLHSTHSIRHSCKLNWIAKYLKTSIFTHTHTRIFPVDWRFLHQRRSITSNRPESFM